MRVIAGEFRNRPIITPKGSHTRPTASRTRASVFNILQESVSNSRFLDICAGSGAMGIEALSRGAAHAMFIENNLHAIDAIRKNITQFNIKSSSALLAKSAPLSLQALAKSGQTFDIIYFDPPYSNKDEKNSLTTTIMLLIDTLPILVKNGTFFVEERDTASIENLTLTTLTLKSKRTFGQTTLREYFRFDK